MNVRNRRGIDNLLLRRVRRHQSMTALFRAPNTDSERPRIAQAWPIIQKQEQDSPIEAHVAEVSPSPPVIPARSDTVARKVVPLSTPKPLSPLPLTPSPSTPVASEPTKTPDPVWKRLQTIFRKHEEHNDSDTAGTTNMEAGAADPIEPQAHKEKEPSKVISTEEEHFLPAQDPMATIPLTRTAQRSSENAEQKSETTSPSVQRKEQPPSSSKPEATTPTAAHNTEFKPALPEKRTEVNDQVSAEPEIPSLSLESVWNVQRVEAQHPLFQENMYHPLFDSADVDTNKTSVEMSPVHEQKPTSGPIQLPQEDDPPTETQISESLSTSVQREEAHGPVEILSPSRPRPPQTDSPSRSTSVQRQSQDHPDPKEISESSPVNTAIGPLPADLWWLLGQKPPAAPASQSQPDIQRTIQPDQKQAPLEQSHISNPHTPAEQPVETPILPHTIQRQALSQDPPPSHGQEPANSARAEESKRAEPDLDDLVRRVYAEIRHRLAAEWERRR